MAADIEVLKVWSDMVADIIVFSTDLADGSSFFSFKNTIISDMAAEFAFIWIPEIN